jgi:hypothetical protein
MANEQEKLARGFPALADALDGLDPPVDWQVAVLTTSVDEHFGPCDASSPGAAEACAGSFGGGGFACEGGACVRRFRAEAGRLNAAAGSAPVLSRAALGRGELLRLFDANVRVGIDGARQEQPLRAVRLALQSGGLAPLLRPDARLVVVVASDEDDCSDAHERLLALEDRGGRLVDRCAAESRRDSGLLDDVDAWARAMREASDVVMAVLAGIDRASGQPGPCRDEACVQACAAPARTAACESSCAGALRVDLCRSECLEQCASFCGSDAPGRRLARASAALGGRVTSICDSDYGPALASLARVLGIPEALDLPSVPSDDRAVFFEVRRAGRTIDCAEGPDFALDPASVPPRLVISPVGACRLSPGDAWTVRYLKDVGR